MRKIRFLIIFLMVIIGLNSCKNNYDIAVDYPQVETFEAELNKGEDLIGKTVTINVDKFVPDSAYGYNIQTGEHLNFCSDNDPKVSEGDKITVKIISVKKVLLFYIITYEMV